MPPYLLTPRSYREKLKTNKHSRINQELQYYVGTITVQTVWSPTLGFFFTEKW